MKNTSTKKTTIKKWLFKKEHVNSIKRHVEQLEIKKLSRFIPDRSPDFVLFLTIEPAFAMALNEDTTLYNKV
jgi:DNA recombination protein RmuC